MRVKEKVKLAFGSIEGREEGMPVGSPEGSAVTLGEGAMRPHSCGWLLPAKPPWHSCEQ